MARKNKHKIEWLIHSKVLLANENIAKGLQENAAGADSTDVISVDGKTYKVWIVTGFNFVDRFVRVAKNMGWQYKIFTRLQPSLIIQEWKFGDKTVSILSHPEDGITQVSKNMPVTMKSALHAATCA